jgi:hypothetical protein
MRRTFGCCWAGPAAIAWFASAVVSAMLPGVEARAGCNHPWVKVTGVAATTADLHVLEAWEQRVHAERASPIPQDHSYPCAGGACSPAPGLPPISIVMVPGAGELWCDLASELPGLFPRCQRVSPEIIHRHATLGVTRLERPPRSAASC